MSASTNRRRLKDINTGAGENPSSGKKTIEVCNSTSDLKQKFKSRSSEIIIQQRESESEA
jgi:hypothetical protein